MFDLIVLIIAFMANFVLYGAPEDRFSVKKTSEKLAILLVKSCTILIVFIVALSVFIGLLGVKFAVIYSILSAVIEWIVWDIYRWYRIRAIKRRFRMKRKLSRTTEQLQREADNVLALFEVGEDMKGDKGIYVFIAIENLLYYSTMAVIWYHLMIY